MDFRIADTFLASVTRFTADEQKAVKLTAFDLQMNPANPGLQFHKLESRPDMLCEMPTWFGRHGIGVQVRGVDRLESLEEAREVTFAVEIEREEDGRWIAEVPALPGVLAYGGSEEEAKAKVQALALRVVADRLEHGEEGPELLSITFAAA
jgi:predicted RNase H-like HicB family nuclease